MRFSFTLDGGLGDFILKYLGKPGNRIASLLRACEIDLRMVAGQTAGHQLLEGNPFFKRSEIFPPTSYKVRNLKRDDISFIGGLESYKKIQVPLWLSEEEEKIFNGLKRPYAVMHPYASNFVRDLRCAFSIPDLAQWVADYSGIPLVVLGQEEFGYESSNVINLTGKGSPRLACKIVEHSVFFIGSHSSMQCAASVYEVPGFCMGPGSIMFHDFSAPNSYKNYLRPLFLNNSMFMFFSEADKFKNFFTQFLSQATALTPQLTPELTRRRITLSNRVLADCTSL